MSRQGVSKRCTPASGSILPDEDSSGVPVRLKQAPLHRCMTCSTLECDLHSQAHMCELQPALLRCASVWHGRLSELTTASTLMARHAIHTTLGWSVAWPAGVDCSTRTPG